MRMARKEIKPGLHNYFFAQAVRIAVHGGGLALSILVVRAYWQDCTAPYSAWLIFYLLAAFAAYYLLGMILGGMILSPLLHVLARKMNGGPFAVNDRVLILAGPHKGKVVSIYELWPSRFQLRGYLGEEEKKKVTDVLDDHQVWRVTEDKSEEAKQQR
jgi:hypothetical protein